MSRAGAAARAGSEGQGGAATRTKVCGECRGAGRKIDGISGCSRRKCKACKGLGMVEEPAPESGERVRLSLRERVTAVLGEGVVDLFEVAGTDAEVVLSLRSLDEIDALPAVRDTLDHAGFEAVSVGKTTIVVSEVA